CAGGAGRGGGVGGARRIGPALGGRHVQPGRRGGETVQRCFGERFIHAPVQLQPQRRKQGGGLRIGM
ncbi:hypothetical protein HMPREF9946_02412, partial [Acetobacteraceae bacterium AT-5844]